MTNHKLTFTNIKELLKCYFAERISEFENQNGILINYGTALTWTFSFRKKTTKKTITQNGFKSYVEIESEIEKTKIRCAIMYRKMLNQ